MGWLRWASVIDLFFRRVVGRAMKAEMTAQLVIDALIMAIWRRGRPNSLVHHSDQGSQCTSEQIQRLMSKRNSRAMPQMSALPLTAAAIGGGAKRQRWANFGP